MTTRRQGSANRSRGLWIAFFGPDGAGKSAVIERLQSQPGPHFPSVIRFHFRPMFRTCALDQPPVLAPHSKPARGTLFSLCKLFYWLMDCWFGYLMVIRPGLSRSRLVIFDRYLHDVLVDPARYRLPASSLWLARLLVQLAPRPDLCILLDVPADILQNRKSEVSTAESHRQRLAYLEMFHALPDKLLVDANCPVDEVTRRVGFAILACIGTSSSAKQKVVLIANF